MGQLLDLEKGGLVGKVDDYNLSKVSNELENFKEDVSNILNYGKYSSQVVTAVPTWVARNGEFVLYSAGTIKRLYFYNSNTWDYIEYDSGSTGGSGTKILPNDVVFSAATMLGVLSFPALAGETWTFEFYGQFSNTEVTTMKFNASGTSATRIVYRTVVDSGNSIVTGRVTATDTYADLLIFNAVGVSEANGVIQFQAGSSGNVTTTINGGNGSNCRLYGGAYIAYRKVF